MDGQDEIVSYFRDRAKETPAVARNNPRRVSLGGKRAWLRRLAFYGCYGDAIASFRSPINSLISAGPYAVSKISR